MGFRFRIGQIAANSIAAQWTWLPQAGHLLPTAGESGERGHLTRGDEAKNLRWDSREGFPGTGLLPNKNQPQKSVNRNVSAEWKNAASRIVLPEKRSMPQESRRPCRAAFSRPRTDHCGVCRWTPCLFCFPVRHKSWCTKPAALYEIGCRAAPWSEMPVSPPAGSGQFSLRSHLLEAVLDPEKR